MERTITGLSGDELANIIDNSLRQIVSDYGHVDEGYCLTCDDQPFEALEEMRKRLNSRPDWPTEVHREYLRALMERDAVQEKLDNLLEQLKCACGGDCGC